MGNSIIWFRNDLRLSDNPALIAALKHGRTTALYIHETTPTLRPIGAAARWWLHNSLNHLGNALASLGIDLRIESGEAIEIINNFSSKSGADGLFWNRRYAPAEREIDTAIKAALHQKNLHVQSFSASLLAEPWTIQTGQNKPYSVFTPFYKALRQHDILPPAPAPTAQEPKSAKAFDQAYKPPRWTQKLASQWHIGETAAQNSLVNFLDAKLANYPKERDFPAQPATSLLSPHLHFGEISPRQIWHSATQIALTDPTRQTAADKFLSELAWRDFNYHQLYHRPDIATQPMQPKYAQFPWRFAPDDLQAWQRGQTGFPIIDAGMRELWKTGFMQNRVRMLTASFLTKNLLIDWRLGENWFWNCLLDADGASNPGNWQWVAGSGLDAAPYFRIFNPIIQGEKFDPQGDYVRHFVPELKALPDKFLHRPFEAANEILAAANITLGHTYPKPITELKPSRQRALAAAKTLSTDNT